jgi:exodeoxyribonuclease VII large subunit
LSSYSLFELNEYIRQVLALNLPEPIWVRCEFSQVKPARGHYFIDLVQKDERKDEIVAQGQAVLWNKEYRGIQQRIGLTLNALLQEGIEALILVKVEFHERYGLKLFIQDVDPAYTLGKLEMKRREAILQLRQTGLLDLNKEIPLPPVLQRIAILSSEGAAGYKDFLNQLEHNTFGYSFYCSLFQTSVQGEYVELEIISQLEKIAKQKHRFDCLVVIRGGGARLDLSAFDRFELCRAMAQCPVPVLTGIGHEIDQTVLDMVCHTSLKTPTAVAEFIIQRNLHFENQVMQLGLLLKNQAIRCIKDGDLKIQYLWQAIRIQVKTNYRKQRQLLEYIDAELPSLFKSSLNREKIKLHGLEKSVQLLSPEAVLKRGFSLTLKNGKVVTKASALSAGEVVETLLSNGSFSSKVIQNE